jgi:hypothetical protein
VLGQKRNKRGIVGRFFYFFILSTGVSASTNMTATEDYVVPDFDLRELYTDEELVK